MGFYGKAFSFDGIPCETFDLALYDIGNGDDKESEFASAPEIVDEVVGDRWKPYFYGVQYTRKQEIELVFGASIPRVDAGKYLEREEIAEIASWLTGKDGYRVLEIEQEDMTFLRYKVIFTSLTLTTYGKIPWALRAVATCDSPFAYMYPQVFQYSVNGSATINFCNYSSHNGYYMPKVTIEPTSGGNFSITNESDDNRKVEFTNIPASVKKITLDCGSYVLTNDQSLNLYPNYNFKNLRLKRGYNTLKAQGNGTLKIECEFPVNTGG